MNILGLIGLIWLGGMAVTYMATMLEGWEPITFTQDGILRLAMLIAAWPIILLAMMLDPSEDDGD